MSAPCASLRQRGLAAAIAPLLALGLAACGGGGSDDHGIEVTDVTGIAATIPGLAEGRLSEEVLDQHPWKPVPEAGLDSGWKGQYLAQYKDVAAGIERMSVWVDVYGKESQANKRAAAEQRLTEDFLKTSLSPGTAVEAIAVSAAPSCVGFSIKHSAIISQYEVYCQSGTAVIYVRTIGRDEPAAIALASSLATDLTEAVDAAATAGS